MERLVRTLLCLKITTMPNVHISYSKELFQQFGYFTTWLPNLKIALGDIGYLTNNQFTKVSTLSDLDIPFTTDETHNTITLDYASAGGLSVQIKGAGELPLPNSALLETDAGCIIQFSKENALLFKADQTKTTTITNNLQLGQKIIERYKAKQWERAWVVITELIQTGTTSIIMSNAANAKIELKGTMELTSLNSPALTGELSLVNHQNIALRIIGEKGLTPLFKSMKIKGLNPFNPGFRNARPRIITYNEMASEELDFVACEFEEG